MRQGGINVGKMIQVLGTQERRSRTYTKKIKLQRFVETYVWTVDYRTMDYKLAVKIVKYPWLDVEEITIIDLTNPRAPFSVLSKGTPEEAIESLIAYKKCRIINLGDLRTSYDGSFVRVLDSKLFEQIGGTL